MWWPVSFLAVFSLSVSGNDLKVLPEDVLWLISNRLNNKHFNAFSRSFRANFYLHESFLKINRICDLDRKLLRDHQILATSTPPSNDCCRAMRKYHGRFDLAKFRSVDAAIAGFQCLNDLLPIHVELFNNKPSQIFQFAQFLTAHPSAFHAISLIQTQLLRSNGAAFLESLRGSLVLGML
jgi:hypothetical protein